MNRTDNESLLALPECACGCGERVAHKRNRFLFNHQRRLQGEAFHLPKAELPFCACGCGERVKHSRSQFLQNHRGPDPMPVRLCACGCGQPVTKISNEYLKGHNGRIKKEDLPFCACGCGTRLNHPMQKWVRGHSSRKYCACGCGELAPPHHQFIQNHHKAKDWPLCACGCGERVNAYNRRYRKGHATRAHIGPSACEQAVQRVFQKAGRAFLFNCWIENRYRPDFQFPEAMLVVEVDGPDHDMGSRPEADAEREAWLAARGYRILRWKNAGLDERLPELLADFERIYQSRLFSCQGSVSPVADEPHV